MGALLAVRSRAREQDEERERYRRSRHARTLRESAEEPQGPTLGTTRTPSNNSQACAAESSVSQGDATPSCYAQSMRLMSAAAFLLIAGGSIAWMPWPGHPWPKKTKAEKPAPVASAPTAVPEAKLQLSGLWERTDLPEKDDVRFYFFHPSGIGLYRFGKLGLNHTHMFRYVQAGSKLAIVFSRSGEHHEMTVSQRRRGEASFITLSDDPREGGKAMSYRRRPMPNAQDLDFDAAPTGFDRMWIHTLRSQKGADAFAMYQFQKPDASGRGNGWFHHGDYDEWTTESLNYVKRGQTLELNFELMRQRTQTRFELSRSADGRLLRLERDPRGFWQQRRFLDQGPSFAMAHSMLMDVGLH